MLCADLRLAKTMMHNRLEEAGSLVECEQESWRSEMGRRLATWSANPLVATGARLVCYGLPPYCRTGEGSNHSLPAA